MSGELLDLSARALLTKFGSGGHKPGSGSAAALLGVMACKLLQTVITLSANRDDYKEHQGKLALANENILAEFEPALINAVQEDSVQFDRVISLRRARDAATNETTKRRLREQALDELKAATKIPLNIAELSIRLGQKGLEVFDFGFRAALGDSGVAISSALAAASGSLSIIYLNLTSFKGGEWARETRIKADALAVEVGKLHVELFNRLERLQAEVMARESQS